MQEVATSLNVNEATLRLVLDRGARARSELVQGWSSLVMSFVNKYRGVLSETERQDLAIEGKARKTLHWHVCVKPVTLVPLTSHLHT